MGEFLSDYLGEKVEVNFYISGVMQIGNIILYKKDFIKLRRILNEICEKLVTKPSDQVCKNCGYNLDYSDQKFCSECGYENKKENIK